MPLFFFFFAVFTVVCLCFCLCACIISAVLISGRLSSSKLRASYCTSTALIHKQNTDTFHYLLTKKKKKKKKRKRKVVGQRQPTKTVLHTEKKKGSEKKKVAAYLRSACCCHRRLALGLSGCTLCFECFIAFRSVTRAFWGNREKVVLNG